MQGKKVHIVSLGCPKNLVDSEVMAGLLAEAGCLMTEKPEEADVILINTCAFILPAREEAIAEILRMAAWKQSAESPCRHLIVTGCLPQRYGKGLADALPEVDLFLGTAQVPHIGRHLEKLAKVTGAGCRKRTAVGRPTFLMNAGHRRLVSTPANSAYLKIADGCSNRCSYCVIPDLRGKARSRPVEDIVKEARGLAELGIREVIVTAQDTTAYGLDRRGKPTLSRLLRELARIEGLSWIRLLYTHPDRLTAELLETIAAEEKICNYLDIPIQHSHDAILGAMHRKGDSARIREVIGLARRIIPGVALRTSLIVGFPGETRLRFESLLSFVREIRFDHLGVFPFSREEGTPAATLPSRISEREKETRRNLVMEEQALISHQINRSLIGTRQDFLVEGPAELADYDRVGRCRRQAPEIDGVTHLKGSHPEIGTIVPCRIIAADDYDLFAEPL
jgi:ribosomal protein S12 methylthiotransferase